MWAVTDQEKKGKKDLSDTGKGRKYSKAMWSSLWILEPKDQGQGADEAENVDRLNLNQRWLEDWGPLKGFFCLFV